MTTDNKWPWALVDTPNDNPTACKVTLTDYYGDTREYTFLDLGTANDFINRTNWKDARLEPIPLSTIL